MLNQLIKTVFNQWTFLSLFLMVLSLVIYLVSPSLLEISFITFVLSTIMSLLIWNLIGSFLGFLPRTIQVISIGVVSVVVVFFTLVGMGIYEEFNVFVDQNLIALAVTDPEYLQNVSEVFFKDVLNVLIALISIIGLTYFLSRDKKKREKKTKLDYLFISISLLIVLIGQNQFRWHGLNRFTPIDMSYLFVTKDYIKNQENLRPMLSLRPSGKRMVPNKGREAKYNIVFVLQESMSVEPLSVYGYRNDYMPFFKSWVDKEKNHFVLFKDAMAISGCTDMSVPTLFTGVGPEEMSNKIMMMPFAWDYAKANGYETALITSQRYSWANFSSFLKNRFLDKMYSAEDSGLEIVNDLGVDDVAISLVVKDHILKRKRKSPLFLAYNTNALHGPYQDKSNLIEIPTQITERYGKAMYIIDKSMENMYNGLKETGELDRTIFIFTADHGNYAIKRGQRLSSFLKETLQIPIMFRFPSQWITENPEKYKMIQSNVEKRVTNLDLIPTIVDLLQSRDENEEICKQLIGTSLFDTITNDRMITCLSTNDYRSWTNEGFGLYKDTLSYLLDTRNKEQLYDLKRDTNQYHNIIDSVPSFYLDEYLNKVQGNKHLRRIYRAIKK